VLIGGDAGQGGGDGEPHGAAETLPQAGERPVLADPQGG
jgi:hypothetical protein